MGARRLCFGNIYNGYNNGRRVNPYSATWRIRQAATGYDRHYRYTEPRLNYLRTRLSVGEKVGLILQWAISICFCYGHEGLPLRQFKNL